MIEIPAKDLVKVLIGNRTMLKSLGVQPENKVRTKATERKRENGR
jgi:hypothetical protein